MANDGLTITDNRTGKSYEIPIQYGTYPEYGATINALDLRRINGERPARLRSARRARVGPGSPAAPRARPGYSPCATAPAGVGTGWGRPRTS